MQGKSQSMKTFYNLLRHKNTHNIVIRDITQRLQRICPPISQCNECINKIHTLLSLRSSQFNMVLDS